MFAAYLIFFSWLVTIIPFFKNSGLSASQLIIVFLLKVIAGIFYGWIGVYYGELAQMVDTWSYHYESLKAYELLKVDRSAYWASLFSNVYGGYGNFFSSQQSWWNDLHNNSFIMLLSLFDFLSFGNYYTNIIFYSLLSFFGPVGIYRVMLDVFPNKKNIVFTATFLLPSFIYWTSGLHKDGVVFAAFILIIYNIYFGLKEKGFTIGRLLLIVAGLLLLLVFRNFLLLLILPAILGWVLQKKTKWKPVVAFSLVYAVSILLFFSARIVSPGLNFPQAVVDKQQSFINLKGGSPLPVKKLEPSFQSFITNAPQAASLTLLRPFPSDVKHLLSFAAFAEIYLILCCFLLLLFFHDRGQAIDTSFTMFCIFFSVTVLLTIGYTVNFLGAIVRYRSIVLPFLVIPMLASIDWNSIPSIQKRILK